MDTQNEKLPQVSAMRLIRRIPLKTNAASMNNGVNGTTISPLQPQVKDDKTESQIESVKQQQTLTEANTYVREKSTNTDIIIGIDKKTGEPIKVSQVDLCAGSYLLGMQGVGKTSALIALAVQQLRVGGSVFVIDPTMDMINSIISRMPEDRVNDTYLLDLTNFKFPFDLNIFNATNKQGLEAHVTILRQSMKAFEKLWSEVGSQVNFSNVLYPVIETILAVPDLSLAHAKRLLLDDEFRRRCIARLQNTDADLETLNFWEEYDNLSNSDRKDLIRAFLGRLTKLLRDPYVKYIICQTDTPKDNKNVDLREAILQGRNIFVYLPITERSAYEDASKFIGTFFMMQFYEAIFSFRKGKRPGCMFIVDEFENYAFAGKDFEGIYSKARKYGCKLILAHQHRGQLHEESMKIIRDATTGANIIVCFRTNDKDPQDMARLFSGYTYYDEAAANEPFWDEEFENDEAETEKTYEDEECDEDTDEDYTRKPTAIHIDPHKYLGDAKNPPIVKEFYWNYVRKLEDAAKMRIETEKLTDSHGRKTEREVYPTYAFGIGTPTQFDPAEAAAVLELLDRLFYASQRDGGINEELTQQFLHRFAKLAGIIRSEAVPDDAVQQQLDNLSKQLKELEAEWKLTEFKLLVVIGTIQQGMSRLNEEHNYVIQQFKDTVREGCPDDVTFYKVQEVESYKKRLENLRKSTWDTRKGKYEQLQKSLREKEEEKAKLESVFNQKYSELLIHKGKLQAQLMKTIEVGDTTEIERILTPVVQTLIAHPLAADTVEIERERKQWEQERVRAQQKREEERVRTQQKREQELAKEQQKREREQEKRARAQRKREWEREQNANKTLTAAQLSELLPKQRDQHAFVKVRGAEIYRMETIDINVDYPQVSSPLANSRKDHIIKQTKETYCRGRKTVAAQINAVSLSLKSDAPGEDTSPDPETPPKQKTLPSGERGGIKRQHTDLIEE